MHWSWHFLPESQRKSQVVPLHVAVPPDGSGQWVHELVPQDDVLALLTHSLLQAWKPARQRDPQTFPSQVASALFGDGQGIHELPQLLRSVSATQLPPQSCFPDGHCPLHAAVVAMQTPAHSFNPVGQVAWHSPLLPQVASPPWGFGHGEHEVPHDSGLSLGLHSSPHL